MRTAEEIANAIPGSAHKVLDENGHRVPSPEIIAALQIAQLEALEAAIVCSVSAGVGGQPLADSIARGIHDLIEEHGLRK